MVIDLLDLRRIRRQIGLTQHDLSQLSRVSQSMIAKIEAGKLDPAYSKALRIITALETSAKKNDLSAGDILNKKIISVKSCDGIEDAVKKMKQYEISQIPVIDDKPVGSISETVILDALLNRKIKSVAEIMSDVPPIISKKTSVQVVSELLKFYQMVLVSEKGKLVGIITRADVIRNM
jgi:predicted transcriptional regulator